MTLGLFIAAAAWRAAEGWGGGAPRPADPPVTLLCGPVNATWAANNTGFWRSRGVDGFIYSNLVSPDDLFPAAPEADPLTRVELFHEIRLATGRLREGGLPQHFLLLALAPERPYFTDPSLAQEAVERLRGAGVFVRKTGLTGIALDLRSSSLFYFPHWDGYKRETLAPNALPAGASAFGEGLARSFLEEAPGARILLIVDGVEASGPLLLDALGGMARALGGAPEAQIHLLTRETFGITSFEAVSALVTRTRHLFQTHLSSRDWQVWRFRGGVGLGMAPLIRAGWRPKAALPPEAFAEQRLVFGQLADTYVWVEDIEHASWRLTRGEARTYGDLEQGGAAQQVLPVYEETGDYAPVNPLRAYERAGILRVAGGLACALRGPEGAALYLPQGGATGRLGAFSGQVRLTDVLSGETVRLAAPGSGETPIAPHTLIEGLPVRSFVMLAGLWLETDDPIAADSAQWPLRLGFVNASGLRVKGSLDCAPSRGFSVKPSNFAVDLAPGETFTAQPHLVGSFRAGEAVPLRLALTVPGGEPFVRDFQMPVAPRLLWEQRLDSAPVGEARLLEGSGEPRIVVAGREGELAAWDRRGVLRWREAFLTGIEWPPAAGAGAGGEALLAVMDRSGKLIVWDGEGARRWAGAFRPKRVLGAPGWVSGGDSGLQLVLPFENRLRIFSPEGEALSEYPLRGDDVFWVQGLSGGGDAEALFVGVRQGAGGELRRVGGGKAEWRTLLPAAPTAAPALLVVDGDTRLLAPCAGGILAVVDLDSGVMTRGIDLETDDIILGLETRDTAPGEGPAVLITTMSEVIALDASLALVWRVSMAAAAAAKAAGPRLILVPTRAEGLVALSMDGSARWRDSRPGPFACQPPAVADLDGDGALDAVYTASDRMLRAIRLE